MVVPKLADLTLKFRRIIDDDVKKDNTFYTLTSMQEVSGVDSIPGSVTNQEIADWAENSINSILQEEAEKAAQVLARKKLVHTFSELAMKFPDAIRSKDETINLDSGAIVTGTQLLHMEKDLGNQPNDYLQFVSGYAQAFITTSTDQGKQPIICADLAFLDEISRPGYSEYKQDIYITFVGDSDTGVVKIFYFTRPSPLGATYKITYRYLAYQPKITVDATKAVMEASSDIILSSKYDGRILERMVALYQSIGKIAQV